MDEKKERISNEELKAIDLQVSRFLASKGKNVANTELRKARIKIIEEFAKIPTDDLFKIELKTKQELATLHWRAEAIEIVLEGRRSGITDDEMVRGLKVALENAEEEQQRKDTEKGGRYVEGLQTEEGK